MKVFSFLIGIIFLFISIECSTSIKTSDIRICKNRDTVDVGELFRAELHIENYSKRSPDFYIIGKNDTNRIRFNDTIRSAIFQGKGHKAGPKKFKGFAVYFDSIGRLKKEDFEISFVIK